MSALAKRVIITLFLLSIPPLAGLLFTMEFINVEWISTMEIQPSFRPMEAPLPLPERSIPIEGAAFIPGIGAPQNPVTADSASISRGGALYAIHCTLCHGPQGKGDGPIAESLLKKPANLTIPEVVQESDGALFLAISNGVSGVMPPLRENLLPRDRWDVVNYLRSLQK